jgi:hypothetical protein
MEVVPRSSQRGSAVLADELELLDGDALWWSKVQTVLTLARSAFAPMPLIGISMT